VNGDRADQEQTTLAFRLTPEQANAAASRAGLRVALAGRLSRDHIAPLVAFALFIAFVAILSFTGLMARRLGEAALIVAAIAFMAARMIAHWRMRALQKNSIAAAKTLQNSGPMFAKLDESGVRIESDAGSVHLAFADCGDAEDADGIIYLWPRNGAPAFIPANAFASEEIARTFLANVRQGIRRATRR
jgi:hypothetical protein